MTAELQLFDLNGKTAVKLEFIDRWAHTHAGARAGTVICSQTRGKEREEGTKYRPRKKKLEIIKQASIQNLVPNYDRLLQIQISN